MTEGSAGMDLCADIDGDLRLAPLERTLIPTGIAVALPMGFEAQIRPRSGLAFKQGLTMVKARHHRCRYGEIQSSPSISDRSPW
jgi:dUTP pyrophosphatase